jgi:hypothetical protein
MSSPVAPSMSPLMPLPPPALYSSLDRLYDSIQAFALKYGYAFTIGRSRDNGTSRCIVQYYCDHYGDPPVRNHSESPVQPRKRRRTNSRKTGCKFSINAVQIDNEQWELRHRPDAKFCSHNHPPSQSSTSHPSHRRPNQETIHQQNILRQTTSNQPYFYYYPIANCVEMNPRQQLAWVDVNSTSELLPSDIYNLNANFQRNKLHGLSSTNALVKDLSDRGIHHAIKVDDDNRVSHLFIAYPESIKLALRNQDVVLADCTYSTNRFNVPLLHIVGT